MPLSASDASDASGASSATGAPNILWYCSDQQRFDTIGALGNPHVHTPHLDRLVREGVAFTHAYCQAPICTPSRASFLTGKYPSTLHVNTNGNTHFPAHERLVTRRLADSGYDCGLVGKLHLAGAAWGREPRVDDGYRYVQYSHAPRHDWLKGHDYADWLTAQGLDPGEVLRVKSHHQGPLHEPDPEHDNVPVPLHQTTWSTEKTLEFIADRHGERGPQRPWLVSVNTGQAPPEQHRDFVRSEYYDAVALPHPTYGTMYRERRWKLVVYHGLEVGELYDMEADPHEFANLWDDPASTAVKLSLVKHSFDATVRAMDYGPARIMPS